MTVLSNEAMTSSYRLSTVTMPLPKAIWPQFTMEVFSVHSVPLFGKNRGVVGGLTGYCRVLQIIRQPYLLVQTVFR